jgi:hypothetical protein
MFAKRFGRLAFVMLAAAVVFSTGCDSKRPKTAVVRGKVTYDGRPVPNGTITFIPTSGPTATGEIQSDGSYTLTTSRSGDGAVLGQHKVVIVAMQDMSGRLPEERVALPPPIIPEKYTSIATSDLRAEVQEGENTFNFDLGMKKKK